MLRAQGTMWGWGHGRGAHAWSLCAAGVTFSAFSPRHLPPLCSQHGARRARPGSLLCQGSQALDMASVGVHGRVCSLLAPRGEPGVLAGKELYAMGGGWPDLPASAWSPRWLGELQHLLTLGPFLPPSSPVLALPA